MRVVSAGDVAWARRREHIAAWVRLRVEGLIGTDAALLIRREVRKDGLLRSLLCSSSALGGVVNGIVRGCMGIDCSPYSALTILAHLHLEALILGQMLITARHWTPIMQVLV